jgi:hypothetical protein
MSHQSFQQIKFTRWPAWISLVVVLPGLSVSLAWVSSKFQGLEGWASFLGVELLSAGFLIGAWQLLKSERPPRWLGMLLIGAALLRLAAGAIWFIAMPVWGHASSAEKSGYIMADARERDRAAWEIASSDKSLWRAFQNNRAADQYGGLLFLSALIYRYLGSQTHQPLVMVVVAAAFSALAVLFTWAFTRRAWGEKAATLAACIMALYPEAVLIGSSQMREAFTVTLTVSAFYGLLRYQQDHSRVGLLWVLASLMLYLPFSPPFTTLLLGMLILAALLTTTNAMLKDILRQRWLWVAIGIVLLLVLIGLWLALKQFVPKNMVNPFEMVSWWLRKSSGLQAYLSKHASGWLQKVFKTTPQWVQLPLLLGYGVFQPFLPAALIVGSQAPIWPWIAVWRSVGWTILLALLIYAPLLALRRKDEGRFARVISLIVWLGILIASFRGGGDLWDNPRYREAFAGLQVALTAWALVEQHRVSDPWLRRALCGIAAILAWFLPWYLRRYTPAFWPVVDLFKTLGLGIASACLLALWDWARTNNELHQ